jgi:trimeric autotransporter adhesin
MKLSLSCRALPTSLAFLTLLFFGGCTSSTRTATPVANTTQGGVHGGQQPVSGATIQLYAAGTTGDGSAAAALLSNTVTTDASGGFRITAGSFTCPSPTALVYIVATGGNPGLAPGSSNPTLALMAALGPCGSLGSYPVSINELTTVAAVVALTPFMSSNTGIGSGSSDAQALADAFTLASQYVDISTGTAPGTNLPAGTSVPVAELNTLANILAACINSAGGVAGDGSTCGTLFSLTTPSTAPGTPAPSDTITAALRIAQNPTLNTAALFNLVYPTSPFQPQLTIPPVDFTVHLIVPSALSVAPVSLTFPAATLGYISTPQSITLANAGQSQVTITTIALAGANAANFTQTNNCPATLSGGASCTAQVTFTPTTADTQSGYLTVSSSASNYAQIVPLSGSGIAVTADGPITLTPSSIGFIEFGSTRVLTLSNYGTTPLAIQSITATGPFSQTNNCGTSLAAQSVCSISVTANNESITQATGSVTVVDNATAGSTQTALLSAKGTIDFGAVTMGNTASTAGNTAAENTISATGYGAPAQRGQPSYFSVSGTITGTNASDFSILQYCISSSYSSSVLQTCSFEISFTPSAVGTRTAIFSCGNVAQGILITPCSQVTLVGVGRPTGPYFELPATIAATPQIYGTTGSTQFIVKNSGSTTLNLTPALSGAGAANFSVDTSLCTSVPKNTTCTMNLIFSPQLVRSYAATLKVTDTASGVVQTANITGNGIWPPPSVTPQSMNFAVPTGTTSPSQLLSITAPNGDPVAVTANLNPANASTMILFPEGASCASTAQTCQIAVAAQYPTAWSGDFSGYLVVTDTVTGYTTQVPVTVMMGVPVVSLSSTSLSFVSRTVGTTSIAQTITLTNTGTHALQITGISIVGANATDFTQSNNCIGSSITSCTISVSFAPTEAGSLGASVQIISNAPTSPDMIPITGTAN